tara:strand:+ start:382 stop:855 length:474 start_codon:yes stop_codon:yes gene_type:complete
MKLIRVKIKKLRNHFYLHLPKMIIDQYNLMENDEIEISLNFDTANDQVHLWENNHTDINRILFFIPQDTHSINMYNRIYLPAKYRFFFPTKEKDFILETNIGNIRTHLTSNGYFSKGMRQWFFVNGPLSPGDLIRIKTVDNNKSSYKLIYEKKNNNK